MNQQPGWLKAEPGDGVWRLAAGGAWTVDHAAALDRRLGDIDRPAGGNRLTLDLTQLSDLDTAGAWLLHRTVAELTRDGIKAEFAGVSDLHAPLLRLVDEAEPGAAPPAGPRSNVIVERLIALGRAVVEIGAEAKALVNFFGLTMIALAHNFIRPDRFRLVAWVNQMQQTGINAVPIVCLLSFLIGVVLAYQGAFQLKRFGAEIFTVDLLAISILREIGVLLTAILLAGRSGSAFTAQIGTMQVNEEVDALRTLGVDPVEVLVLPRINALLITLPLLTFLSDVVGILGGALMSIVVLDLTFGQFVNQLEAAIHINHFIVGMVKAPVFAYVIAIVGCFEGLRVTGSAESVGKLTTKAVVESIFIVIVVDALFSILFATLEI